MGLYEALVALIVIGLPIMAFTAIFTRWLKVKEKRLEIESRLTIEKAAQYAASNAQLETRIRILEKIVTDGGMETAAQIEALRDLPDRPMIESPAVTETKQ